VFLYNLDDLAKIAETNRSARQAEVARCKVILAEKADGLWRHVRRTFESAPDAGAPPARRSPDAAGHAAAP
jgi:glutamyl-tRNA reductase